MDVNNEEQLATVVKSSLGTKMLAKYMDMAVGIALQAVRTISITTNDYREIDIKRYCRIEKIPGGAIEDSQVIKGVVLNKVSFCRVYNQFTQFIIEGCCPSENEPPY